MSIFKEISEWEVLTPDGWVDFSGVIELDKEVQTIECTNGKKLTGSESHRIYANEGFRQINDLFVGDSLETNGKKTWVTKISELQPKQKVYDLVEVKSDGHKYYTNGFISKNCDEIAFIPPRIQEEFMASTSPALSATKGKMLITSTPNGSRDLFAKLWLGTGMEWDKTEFTYLRKNVARNAYEPLFVPYWIDESKNTDVWIEREKKSLDSPIKWRIEFECLSGNTELNVYDEIEDRYKIITLESMYKTLFMDSMNEQIILDSDGEIPNII